MDSEVKPEGLGRQDIKLDPPPIDGTAIVAQRHEDYIREKDHPKVGELTPEASETSQLQSYDLVMGMLGKLTPEERNQVSIMVFASPTQYMGGGQRSIETGNAVIEGIKNAFLEGGVPVSNLLNSQERLPWGGGPVPSDMITEPKMFEKSPDFVNYLADVFGNGKVNKDFWQAYESDEGEVREKRLELGAEGPADMADRLEKFLTAMNLFSQKFHQQNPGQRLILWTVSHYDTISPYVKTRLGIGKDGYLPVDYGAGFVVNIDPGGDVSARIGDKTYPVSLTSKKAQ